MANCKYCGDSNVTWLRSLKTNKPYLVNGDGLNRTDFHSKTCTASNTRSQAPAQPATPSMVPAVTIAEPRYAYRCTNSACVVVNAIQHYAFTPQDYRMATGSAVGCTSCGKIVQRVPDCDDIPTAPQPAPTNAQMVAMSNQPVSRPAPSQQAANRQRWAQNNKPQQSTRAAAKSAGQAYAIFACVNPDCQLEGVEISAALPMRSGCDSCKRVLKFLRKA